MTETYSAPGLGGDPDSETVDLLLQRIHGREKEMPHVMRNAARLAIIRALRAGIISKDSSPDAILENTDCIEEQTTVHDLIDDEPRFYDRHDYERNDYY